ncbi:MAG TPA: TldD/PmbA family protein [Polyangiaceae bacterium]|nr:TldD/PmbA family protein [Polyangiaceae bacterium]
MPPQASNSSRIDLATLADLAQKLAQSAKSRGVDLAEVKAGQGWELDTKVRLGQRELVQEAGHKSVALRVMRDQRVAVTSSSDLSEAGLERLLRDAFELLELSQPDPFAGPAPSELLQQKTDLDLDLLDPEVDRVDAARATEMATQAERAALDYDKRITLSEGATVSRVTGGSVLVLADGFVGTQLGSYISIVVSPVVEDQGGKRRRGHYWAARRHLADLEPGEEVGREAARRTLRQLGPRKIDSCEIPIVFDPDTARSVIGSFAGCLLGGAIWRRSSYLAEREGSQVASPLITLIDDPLIPRAPGSRVFDGEGVASRRNVVVEQGNLRTFLLDSYAARKLSRSTTASASRGGGSVSASTSNFIMQAGSQSREALIASTAKGLYVTEMMGQGFNPVTGDFSRGATGYWIENGELTFPVSEVTISSNLDRMMKNIDAVANDLDLKTSTAAPTFRVAAMTISGT